MVQATNQTMIILPGGGVTTDEVEVTKQVKTHETIQQVIQNMRVDPAYEPAVYDKLVIQAIQAANEKLAGTNRELQYSVHEKTKRLMVKVLDKSTKEVIREIPPEKVLDYVLDVANINVDLDHQPEVYEKVVVDTIAVANAKLEIVGRELQYIIHEKTNKPIVKVLDKETKEVVREIPSEKVLDYVAAICESQGLLIDEKR